MTSDIVTAEVVEVERPKRPALWIAMAKVNYGWAYTSYARQEKDDASRQLEEYYSVSPECYAFVPADPAPAAATRGADAVEIEAAFRQMAENAAYYNGQGREMDGKFLNGRPLWESYLTPKAREILAALKGA